MHQINTSPGGVPKRPVPAAAVAIGGMAGDDHADKRHHGGPDQDLCLYSLEVIEVLRAEGHPISPGFAGENLTLAGVPWATLATGMRLHIGASLVAELTYPTAPCSKNAAWFLDGDVRRMSHELHPGSSRWYARVVTPGTVRTGDAVTVLDPVVDGPLSQGR